MESITRSATFLVALTMIGCSPAFESRQIASIHAVGVTGPARLDRAYTQIESTLDGLTAIFQREGFDWPGKNWAHAHGKKYEYGWYLTGERTYGIGYVYRPAERSFAQCTVEINRKTAKLTFFESEWPFKSGRFPLTNEQREHIRRTARFAAEYLRQKLPSHDVQISFEEKKR